MNPPRSAEFTLLIPSRGRPESAAHAATLLPMAKVYIDETEAEVYRKVIDPARIITHPPARGIAQVRAMAIRWCPTFWLVMVDDDFKGVISYCGRRPRPYRDPAALDQFIRNMITACNDLELSMFCWNRSAHPAAFRPHDPLHLTAPIAGAFGIGGKDCIPDSRLTAYEDVDLSLQALLRHRVILCDNRYYWDFGRCWHGRGGNQGIRTSNSDMRDREILRGRWGPYLEVGTTGNKRNPVFGKSNVFGMKVRVTRRSPVASTS